MRTRAIIGNNSTNITAFVRVLKDPTGDLWLNLDNDSRKEINSKKNAFTYDIGKTKDSFIFSFKNGNIEDAIISNIKYEDYAVDYSYMCGPKFGNDLTIYSKKKFLNYRNYNVSFCKQCYYEKKIRDTEDNFSIEDYEVFQLVKDNF